jgi:hypothetical protein
VRIEFLRLAVIAIFVLGVGHVPRAMATSPPIFDAHLHYNDEAAAYPVGEVFRRFGDNGGQTILATSANGERLFPAVAGARQRASYARGLLFRLDKAGLPPSYVFGTLHSGDPRVTTLPAAVARAFGTARSFATESVVSAGQFDRFIEAAQFDDGHRLADFFDAETIAEIRTALGAASPPDAILQRLKPVQARDRGNGAARRADRRVRCDHAAGPGGAGEIPVGPR